MILDRQTAWFRDNKLSNIIAVRPPYFVRIRPTLRNLRVQAVTMWRVLQCLENGSNPNAMRGNDDYSIVVADFRSLSTDDTTEYSLQPRDKVIERLYTIVPSMASALRGLLMSIES